jgi:Fe-S-cluster containining protein
MNCRPGCAACCIVVSISSPIPGMPRGKPAGVRCAQLTAGNRCAIYGRPDRPAVCAGLQPNGEMCAGSVEESFIGLAEMERATHP